MRVPDSDHRGLTALEALILDVEAGLPAAAKAAQAVRLTAAAKIWPESPKPLTRWFQVLRPLMERPAALDYAPAAIHRLRAARERAQKLR